MLDTLRSGVTSGIKTPKGRTIAILLILSLAFIAWSGLTINPAFADDSSVPRGIITIGIENQHKTYDGEALTVTLTEDMIVHRDLMRGDKIVLPSDPISQTLVGSSYIEDYITVCDDTDKDVTDEYEIRTKEGCGALIVTDGTPDDPVDPSLVVTKVDVAGEGAVYHIGDTVTFDITATNIYDEAKTITLYEIDGVELAEAAFEADPGETVTTEATYTITAADVVNGGFTNTITATISNEDGEETNQFSASATVETEPIAIEITAASETKAYDGKELTNDGYEITGGELAGGDSIDSVTIEGSQTLVGTSENAPSGAGIVNADDEDVTGCYDITYINGTLEVTDDADPSLVVTKADADEDATAYQVGDTVTFDITATNIYEDAQTITLSEIEGAKLAQSTFEDVEPGDTIETTATYTITEDDVAKGKFTNTVTAQLGSIEKEASCTVVVKAPNTQSAAAGSTTSKPAAPTATSTVGSMAAETTPVLPVAVPTAASRPHANTAATPATPATTPKPAATPVATTSDDNDAPQAQTVKDDDSSPAGSLRSRILIGLACAVAAAVACIAALAHKYGKHPEGTQE